jgi:hypothetical protein
VRPPLLPLLPLWLRLALDTPVRFSPLSTRGDAVATCGEPPAPRGGGVVRCDRAPFLRKLRTDAERGVASCPGGLDRDASSAA